ncbi:MAG TPA: carbohydrate ABC transporter permease [Ktedonobacteraceae bacterium]|nr:carbohydrate ABC transporter permease [Ktedonobacteraceae bacterium]
MATVATNLSRRGFVQRYKLKRDIGQIITHVILLVGGFFWVYPFLWALGSSLKSDAGFLDEGLNIFPKEAQWSNYVSAWNDASFGQYFSNTLVITAATVAFTLIFTSMAGFVLARTNFPGKKILLGLIAITFFLPSGYTIIPVFDLIQRLGLLNTLGAVILVETAGNMVFSTFLFMGYFFTMDRELEDAARVDGATFNQLFWQVMLPLAGPMLATVGLFSFIGSWNNYFIPLVFTIGVPELRTLPVGLYAFISQTSTNWTLLCAASIISLGPIIAVFVFAQRYVVNAVAGAVKG